MRIGMYSLQIYALIFSILELFPENIVINFILLVVIPLVSLLITLFLYFKSKQTNKRELLKILAFIAGILLILYVVFLK